MKKLMLLAITLLLTISLQAQSKVETQAKKLADEMTEVLSLDEDQSAQILAFQVERLTAVEALKKETNGDKDAFKEKAKEVLKPFNKKLVAILGAENMKAWQEHMKAKQQQQ